MAVNAKTKLANKLTAILTSLVKLFQRFSLSLSCLLLLVGISWLFILPTNEYIKQIYISENALLPSSAYAYYSHQKVKYAEEHSKILRELKLKGSQYYSDHLIKELKALGMETSQQKFTIKSDDGTEDIEGINTYGILRAWKSDGSEALLLNSDWESLPSTQGNHNGVAMLLSIAQQFKQSTYWAKDVIFLFTQYHHKGLHQWLKSYHGEGGVEPLKIRSGYIQIALELDLPPSSDKYKSLQIAYEGINGYLPNLDVITTLQRIGDDFRAKTSIHPNSQESDYLNRLTTMLTQLSIQATTIPTKPSGLFLTYDIHGVTLVGVPSHYSDFGWVEIGILIEEAFRSYNNLLERLHHSYNFYIMLSYNQFVSLQMYLPVVGILGAIPLIYSMLSLSKLNQKFSSLKTKPTLGFYNYKGPFLLFLVAQISGWFSYSLMLNYSDKLNNLGIFILPVIYVIQAKLLPILYPANSPIFLEYKLMLLMLTSITTLCLSTLNFGLALVLSILTFPYVILTHLTPIKSYFAKFISLILLVALSPQVLMIIASLVYKWDLIDIMPIIKWNISEGNAWIGSVVGLIYFPLNFGFLQSVLASSKE